MTLNIYNHLQNSNNQLNSNYNNSPSPKNLFEISNSQNNTKRNSNYGETSLSQVINQSIYEEMKNQSETREKLNELRAKYLPNSTKRNNYNFNNSQNMINFNNLNNTNNSNNYFSSIYTDYNNIHNRPNISTEKIDYYQTQKDTSRIFQNSLMDSKDNININESIKFNNDNLKNNKINIEQTNSRIDYIKEDNNLKGKSYLNDYLIKENEKLKIINKNYELLITPLIEYINDINYFFGQNTINFHNINQLVKYKELNKDNNPINDLKSMLIFSKNNIIDSYKYKKSNSFPKNKIPKKEINLYSHRMSYNKQSDILNTKEKKVNIEGYKPIIADRKDDSYKNDMFKSGEIGGIRRAKTVKNKLSNTFWSMNKRVSFKE